MAAFSVNYLVLNLNHFFSVVVVVNLVVVVVVVVVGLLP